MSRLLAALGLAAMLAAGPAVAQEPKPETPKQLLDEAGEKFMRAIELMLMAIPQYEAPEVLDNGDIIIRRKRPATPPAPPSEPPPGKDKLDRT